MESFFSNSGLTGNDVMASVLFDGPSSLSFFAFLFDVISSSVSYYKFCIFIMTINVVSQQL